MTEADTDITYTPLLESHIAKLGEKCHGLSLLHTTSSLVYDRYATYLDLPSIILQIFNGAFSIGSASIFGDFPKASVIIGVIGLITATMNSITGYFGWRKRSEQHKQASVQYAKLYRFIVIELGLPRTERIAAKKIVKMIHETYDSLHTQAPFIPKKTIDEFNKKFEAETNISRPEITNGLERVIIYKDDLDTEKSPQSGFVISNRDEVK